jgi:hypothetical protein
MKKLTLVLAILLIPSIASATMWRIFVGEKNLFPGSMGSTFVKQYDINQESLDADESTGSPTATFTAARGASNPATYIDSDGVVNSTTTSNTPRWTLGYYATNGVFTSGPGLLLEGASTNLLKMGIFATDAGSGLATNWNNSDDVTNAPTYSLVEETVTNISNSKAQRKEQTFGDGTNAQTYSDATAVGSVVQDDIVTMSVWLKGTVTSITSLKLRIGEADAAGADGTQHDSADIKASLSSTVWKRFALTATSVDADASRVYFIILLNHAGSGSMDLSMTGAHLEVAAFPSSFIPTTAAALTRNQENLSYATASNFVGGTDLSIAMFWRVVMFPDEQPGNRQLFFNAVIDGTNLWRLRYGALLDDTIQVLSTSSGTTEIAESVGADPLGATRYALVSSIGTYSTTADGSGKKTNQYIDGSVNGTNVDYAAPVGALPASFSIQSSNNQAMILTGIALFNKRLSAAEAAQVDSILNP